MGLFVFLALIVVVVVYRSIDPLVPAGTIAALLVCEPVAKFNVDTVGRVVPVGYAVTNPYDPVAAEPNTVMFSEYAAAVDGSAGVQPAPCVTTSIVRDVAAASGVAGPEERES